MAVAEAEEDNRAGDLRPTEVRARSKSRFATLLDENKAGRKHVVIEVRILELRGSSRYPTLMTIHR